MMSYPSLWRPPVLPSVWLYCVEKVSDAVNGDLDLFFNAYLTSQSGKYIKDYFVCLFSHLFVSRLSSRLIVFQGLCGGGQREKKQGQL